MMKELQDLKRESIATQKSQIIPTHESKPGFTSPQPRTTYPPALPPRSHPPPLQPLPAPPLPPSTPFLTSQMYRPPGLAAASDLTYWGPRPSIPKLTHRDPGEFARLKMALENLLPPESSELFRYQVLLDHLHLEEAKLIVDAYLHSATPFSDTMNALNDRLGQPHQLALRRIAAVMDSPDIRDGDVSHIRAIFSSHPVAHGHAEDFRPRWGESGQVLLKVVPVILHYNGKTLSTHAVLDDSSERTMLLPTAAQKLDLQGIPETLPLRTIRQDVQTLHGSCVSFDISPGGVRNAFTTTSIDLAEHSYPVQSLQRKYRHLRGLPLQSFKKAKPLLLIGSDHPQLITPTEAIRLGPPGGPAAMRTRLGTLQGPPALSDHPRCHNSASSRLPFLPRTATCRPDGCGPASCWSRLGSHTPASDQAHRGSYLTEQWSFLRHRIVKLDSMRRAEHRTAGRMGLELCGALSGAHLSHLLRNELTLDIKRIVLWSDSTTVLTWLRSESCHFKVFVSTRVAEIQELTHSNTWRYVDSAQNPADDITCGKSLLKLTRPNSWIQGPPFLLLSPEQWPPEPSGTLAEPPGPSELCKETFCGVSTTFDPPTSNFSKCDTWTQLLETAITQLHGAAKGGGTSSAYDYIQAEMRVVREAQQENFLEEYQLFKQGKSTSRSSRLLALSPEFDHENEVIRVGGRLRRSEDLAFPNSHPLVLDPTHPITRLLIQDVDSRLRHPGPERVFTEIWHMHWILRGREAVRRFQRTCLECRRWRAQPMADLSVARLRLYKPAFYSTGMHCFEPFEVKIGRCVEKRWGIIFKCLTIRAVHLDVLTSIDTDAFLMALRLSLPGEEPQLSCTQTKTALYTAVGSQPLQEEVLGTVLVEVERILNSKPLGYVPSDVSDADPVTPNCFLMGQPNGALPQVAYPKEELLSRWRWKHSQVLADHFWSRFIRLYLPSMQLRQKCQSSSADVTKASMLMIVDPQLPRISKVRPSLDGHIRSADIKVKDRTFTRPVVRLVALLALPDDDKGKSP
ncbi:unnamed protein product [Oreochromis niloticus]|nr:unnamed protein product [Mustela putorius furo]